MATGIRRRVWVLGFCSVVLLGASPCSREYQRSRNCSDLALTVEAGSPGMLMPDCLKLNPPQPMEITLTEQVSFTSVPADLRAVLVPTPRSNMIQISAIPTAMPGTAFVRIHTEPLGQGLHQFAHDYRVTVTVLPNPGPRYAIGVTVNGLSGVSGSLVLQDNLADDLTVTADGDFVFPTRLPSGARYSVSVKATPPGQSCSPSNATGTVAAADVMNISVTCVNTAPHYAIGGKVQGLLGTLVLQDNTTDDLTVTADGDFVFSTPLPSGALYSATVAVPPPGQSCTVSDGTGTVAAADVTSISVTCMDSAVDFTVSVLADPPVTPTGGSTTLSAAVSGGIGPFHYAWRGYRDDGAVYNNTLSSPTAAQPTAALVFPGSDFYFFVTVTDLASGDTHDAYVRVHESDDVVAQFTVSPPLIRLGDTVTFDASASFSVVTPIGWTLQYLGNPSTRPMNIEDWLKLQADSNGTLFWTTRLFTMTDVLTLSLVLSDTRYQPGAYRMLLQENGDVSTHQTYEYFWVDP